jgi:hypothetical protein
MVSAQTGAVSPTYTCLNLFKRAGPLDEPILQLQPTEPFELAGIGGHDRGAGRVGVGGDQQLGAADRIYGRFQFRVDAAVCDVAGRIQRQHGDLECHWPIGVEWPWAGVAPDLSSMRCREEVRHE